jgi:gluconokinase
MILILDLGSSSTRALLFDEHANAAPGAMAREPFSFAVDDDGRSEDDAEAAFQRIVHALDQLHAHLANNQLPITDLGISSYASSLICLDEHGAPLTPIYTYADTRCAEDARWLRAQHDEIEALQRTGCRIRANYWPARLHWIRRTLPDVFKRTRWFASLSDYLCWQLFGRMRTGISIASWTGMLNRTASDWDRQWLDALGISIGQLPPIAQDGETLDTLLPEWAARWPRFKDLCCHPPVGDGAAANIGSGCVDENRIAVTIGTTAAMRVVRPKTQDARPKTEGALASSVPSSNSGQALRLPSSLWAYRVDHAHDLIGGATTEGGNVFAWAKQTLNLPDSEAIEAAISQMQPDAHGLTVLPMFAGERSPGFADHARATIHGLTLDTSPVEIARALIEAIAYRLAIIYDSLRQVADPNAILVGSGGALAASPTWCQIIADATGAPLHLFDEPEATSRGVALLVLQGFQVDRFLGVTPDNPSTSSGQALTTSQPANLPTYQPDNQRHVIYRAAMARQQELYAKLI